MDSVSQIALGAAVGEAVLGRKLGNKAMLWGALGGTIPDLDVIANPLLTQIQALAFHRGFSHSICFAVLGGLLMGWTVHKLYESRYSTQFVLAVRSMLLSCIPTSICFFLIGPERMRYYYAAFAILLAGLIFYFINKRYTQQRAAMGKADGMAVVHSNDEDRRQVGGKDTGRASVFAWQWMFFLALLTHALLDCCTMYGTQLFLPFSDYRVAWSTVSVADPFGYTLPFLACLFMASRQNKTSNKRQFWNYLGLTLSSAYLIFTVWHKQKINTIFQNQLSEQNITYNRMTTGPTIFNNFLWSSTVESDEGYYQGQYSIFDSSPITFNKIPKNYNLLPQSEGDKTIETLKWFSDGFYNVINRKDGRLQVNDLRFGTFRGTGDENDYIFRFIVEANGQGGYKMIANEGGPKEGETADIFKALWTRIKGV